MDTQPTGFLLIDKPAGITSHDVIDTLRRITGIRKIGHAGTLDPFATGLLLVAVGRPSTKRLSEFVGLDKTYEAEFVIGATTETLDPEGEVRRDPAIENGVLAVNPECELASFTGQLKQVPPMYAAIKQKGKKLYQLAREGKTVKRPPRDITVHTFEYTKKPWVEDGLLILPVRIACSSGTYIRALARDLGTQLKTLGYVRQLRRTAIGSYVIDDAVSLQKINSENWPTYLKNLASPSIDGSPTG